jgi:hypothetical protein
MSLETCFLPSNYYMVLTRDGRGIDCSFGSWRAAIKANATLSSRLLVVTKLDHSVISSPLTNATTFDSVVWHRPYCIERLSLFLNAELDHIIILVPFVYTVFSDTLCMGRYGR